MTSFELICAFNSRTVSLLMINAQNVTYVQYLLRMIPLPYILK